MFKYIWLIVLGIIWIVWTIYVFNRFIKDFKKYGLYDAFVLEPIMWWVAGHLFYLFIASAVEYTRGV